MEIRKITRQDKKRLWVEITKKIWDGGEFLPNLKLGDEVLIMPIRKLSENQMKKLIGKQVSYFELDENFSLDFEGVLDLNDNKYWDDDEEIKAKYVLLDPEEEEENQKGMFEFNDLNDVFDLKVRKASKYIKISCNRCRKKISEDDKYCKFCGLLMKGKKPNLIG